MCRLGFQEDDTIKLYKKINIIKKFNYVLIMSHLASSSNKNDKYNIIQLNRFKKIKKNF